MEDLSLKTGIKNSYIRLQDISFLEEEALIEILQNQISWAKEHSIGEVYFQIVTNIMPLENNGKNYGNKVVNQPVFS